MDELTTKSCRVCFARCKRSDINAKEVADIFYQSTGSRINEYDIPQKLCDSCHKKLKITHKFKQACIRADEVLEKHRQKMGRSECLVAVEPLVEPKIEIDPIDDDQDEQFSGHEMANTIASRVKSEISENFKGNRLDLDFDLLRTTIRGLNRAPTTVEEFILSYQESKSRQVSPNRDPNQYESNLPLQPMEMVNCEDPKFKCLCESQFSSLDHLRVHNMKENCTSVPLLRPLQCNYCTFSCILEVNMRYHCISMHFDEAPYHCDCKEELYCNDSRLEHDIFKCKNRTDILQTPFKQFIIMETKEPSIIVNVGVRKVKSKKPKKREKAPQARVICEQCGKDILKSRLSDHIGAKHNAKRFECDLCKSSYVEKANLIRHMFYKHLKNQRQYPCPYCDKIYEQSGSRSLHIKKIHTNDLRHVCETCGKRFVKPSKLKYHMATHSGIKNIYLTSPLTLDLMKVFTVADIRNVPCPQCDSMFRSIKDLMGHRSAVHSTRTYTCPICAETFKNSRLLKVHRAVHN